MQRCHRTFLDCVDYENTESMSNILSGFDFFSQIYCQKFDAGQMIDEKEEKNDKDTQLGIYRMIHDIHDETYTTPLASLKDYKFKSLKSKHSEELNGVVWYVTFIISCILSILYLIGLYFTYFDEPESFKRTFSNHSRV